MDSRQKKTLLTVAGLVAFTVLSLGYGYRLMRPMLGAWINYYFPSQKPPAPSPSEAPVASPSPAPTGTASAGDPNAADRALADLQAELTPEKVSANPTEAVRRYMKIVHDYPGTKAAERAEELARPIQAQTAGALDDAETRAEAEIARVLTETAPRLERLEHRSVIVVWRDLETRFVGLPAAARAAAEREKVQRDWDAMPKIEIEASQKFAALPAEPSVAEEAEKRLEIAVGADAIAMRYSKAKFAAFVGRYRDEQLDKFVAALAEVAKRSPPTARQMGARMPDIFQDTDQAKKVREILASLKD